MSVVIVAAALALLMVVAYRGASVILFAPLAALGAVLLTDPSLVAPTFTGLYMDKLVGFLKLYLPVIVLGAIFGKVIETSGFSRSIAAAVIRFAGPTHAIAAIVAVGALLTYGGVSLFVVVFAVYPFAADLFRRGDIPKRLIPGTIALGAFTFTMDALPGSPQIQNIIPTSFFGTDLYAAPRLGLIGAAFVVVTGLVYLNFRRQQAAARGEGFGEEPLPTSKSDQERLAVHPLLATLPLLLVWSVNKALTLVIPLGYGESHTLMPEALREAAPVVQDVAKLTPLWAVEGALLVGILSVFVLAWRPVTEAFAESSKAATGGALLAAVNTASEYGFGAVIASLPGFRTIAETMMAIPHPLVNEAVSVNVLAGITGSASGGMSIALAALADTFVRNAEAAGIPFEVLHRVASMASGGMDTLPHNGAVITLLFVTGLTHRQSYPDIFAVTLLKTAAVFVVIGVYALTGIV